eukprot:gene17884-24276_t
MTRGSCLSALLIASIALGLGAVHVTAMEEFAIQTFTLAELKDPNPETLQRLKRSVFQHGLAAVVDFIEEPAQADLLESTHSIHSAGNPKPYSGAMASLMDCVHNKDLDQDLMSKTMEDGSVRSTLATETTGGVAQPFADPAYASVLDTLLAPMCEGRDCGLKPFQTAVSSAESLEHFHVFSDLGSQDSENPTIELHSDMGLFIVMTAAEYFSTVGSTAQRLAPGKLVKPIIPDGSLLIMNGDGSSRWNWAGRSVNSPNAHQPYAPGHEVIVPRVVGVARAWYGRMYFPPAAATLVAEDLPEEEKDVTFGEYRQAAYEAFQNGAVASASGCMQSRRLLQDDNSCADDELYCWMKCRSILELPCDKDNMICIGPNGFWPEDYLNETSGDPLHCFDCALECEEGSTWSPPMAPPPSPGSSGVFQNEILLYTYVWAVAGDEHEQLTLTTMRI